MMHKTYIFGWNGFLGQEIIEHLAVKKGYKILTIGRSKNSDCEFDLLQPNYSFLNGVNAGDRFVFLAAVSSPDFCSDNYQLAHLVNVVNTKTLIHRLLDKGAHVLFASSDVVYGRTKSPVNESSSINPLFEYAQMKAEIETYFKGRINFYVMRLSYIASIRDRFTKFLITSSKNNEEVTVFDPFIRSMISAFDVVEYVEKFILNPNRVGVLVNLVGNNFISRLQYVEQFSKVRSLQYKTISPPIEFLKKRPDVILLQSLFLSKYLEREPLNVLNTMSLELGKS